MKQYNKRSQNTGPNLAKKQNTTRACISANILQFTQCKQTENMICKRHRELFDFPLYTWTVVQGQKSERTLKLSYSIAQFSCACKPLWYTVYDVNTRWVIKYSRLWWKLLHMSTPDVSLYCNLTSSVADCVRPIDCMVRPQEWTVLTVIPPPPWLHHRNTLARQKYVIIKFIHLQDKLNI